MKTAIEYIYIFILVFAPLAFGSTDIWARLILLFLIFFCATLFFYELRRRRGKMLETPGLMPLMVFGGIMIFQMVPLPAFLVKVISPFTYTLYQDTAGLLDSVGWMCITVNLKSTILQLIQFGGCVLFYVLTIQLLSRAEFLQKTVSIIVRFGGILAVLSLLNHIAMLLSMSNRLLWLRETIHGTPFGPYADHNHYAGLMVMLFPIAFGMLLYNKPQISHGSFRYRVGEFFKHHSINRYLLLFLAVLLMGLSVGVSLSRSGVVFLSLSLLLMGVLMNLRKVSSRGRAIKVGILGAVILFGVAGIGWESVFSRFNSAGDSGREMNHERILGWKDSMKIVAAYPLLGTGAGTFSFAASAFRKTASTSDFFKHAHNDYLEIMAEEGILGFSCFVSFLLSLFVYAKQFRKRKEPYLIYLFWGGVSGLAVILLYCLVESQLQVGANAIYFFLMCGICIAASHTRLRSGRRPTFLKINQKSWIEPVMGSAAAFLLFWGTVFIGGTWLGALHLEEVPDVDAEAVLTERDYQKLEERAFKAALYDPLESRNMLILAKIQAELAVESSSSLDYLGRAIRVNPMNGKHLLFSADFFSGKGQFNLAEKFYQAALKYEPGSSRIHGKYGYWLMKQGFLKRGAKEIKNAIALSPELTKDYVGKMAVLELNYSEMVTALPAMVAPFIDFGEYLIAVNKRESALKAYKRATENFVFEEVVQVEWIQRLCRFYTTQNMLDDAFQVAQIGIKFLPRDSDVRYIMGTIYEKMGILYRAAEEYELAVFLDPQNFSAIRQLDAL